MLHKYVIIMTVSIFIASCGFKGPLYLPKAPEATKEKTVEKTNSTPANL